MDDDRRDATAEHPSRRSYLESAAAVGVTGFLGMGSGRARHLSGERAGPATDETPGRERGSPDERHIVGTSGSNARAAAHSRAEAVAFDLDFGSRGGAVAGRFSPEALVGLRRRPDVRYVEPEATVHAHGQTLPWGVDRVDAEAAHARGLTGAGADVAVLDTGIDADHPDLAANLGVGYAPNPCVDGDCLQPWDDDHGHGTHVAGTVAAVDDAEGVVGVSPGATLHAVKVLDATGAGSASGLAAGLTWAADQGHDVANMSLGGGDFSQTVADACTYAHGEGTLLVASAGNGGPCSDCVGYPAALPTVVAVGATTPEDAPAEFSSTGPELELVAPGVDVTSTVPGGYATTSGTSMASPHVSGAGALLAAAGYANTAARTRLRETAEDLGLADAEQGHGLLDVEAALSSVNVGDVGAASVGQPDRDTWHSVAFDASFVDPVVVAKPLSTDGHQPCHVRLRNVGPEGFEFQLEEWAYLDGAHLSETLYYDVFETGRHTLDGGSQLEVGTVGATHRFADVTFGESFAAPPVVLAQSQTRNGGHETVTRTGNVSTTGFEVRVQEEEGRDGWHTTETIGYVAVEPGTGTLGGAPFEAGRTPDDVTHRWRRIDFQREYATPAFVADAQTFDGSNTAGLRYRNLTGTGVDVRVEEERSHDRETYHTTEQVGYLVVESG